MTLSPIRSFGATKGFGGTRIGVAVKDASPSVARVSEGKDNAKGVGDNITAAGAGADAGATAAARAA